MKRSQKLIQKPMVILSTFVASCWRTGRDLRGVANLFQLKGGVCFVSMVGFRGHHHPRSSLHIEIRDFQISPVTLFRRIDKADSEINDAVFRSQCVIPPQWRQLSQRYRNPSRDNARFPLNPIPSKPKAIDTGAVSLFFGLRVRVLYGGTRNPKNPRF